MSRKLAWYSITIGATLIVTFTPIVPLHERGFLIPAFWIFAGASMVLISLVRIFFCPNCGKDTGRIKGWGTGRVRFNRIWNCRHCLAEMDSLGQLTSVQGSVDLARIPEHFHTAIHDVKNESGSEKI